MLWMNGICKLIYEGIYETGHGPLTWPISPDFRATMWATSTGSSPQRTQSPPSRTEMFDFLVSDMTLEPSVGGILYLEEQRLGRGIEIKTPTVNILRSQISSHISGNSWEIRGLLIHFQQEFPKQEGQLIQEFNFPFWSWNPVNPIRKSILSLICKSN